MNDISKLLPDAYQYVIDNTYVFQLASPRALDAFRWRIPKGHIMAISEADIDSILEMCDKLELWVLPHFGRPGPK